MIERRSFIKGLISLVAAPAIVRVSNIMPVKAERIYTLRTTVPEGEVYGLSPAAQCLSDWKMILEMRVRFLQDCGAFGTEIMEIPGKPNYLKSSAFPARQISSTLAAADSTQRNAGRCPDRPLIAPNQCHGSREDKVRPRLRSERLASEPEIWWKAK
jgi:hypothetical protein